jgi:hypothetical protein
MATFTAARLAGPVQLSTTDTQVITAVPSGETRVVKQLLFTNVTGSAVTVDANLVPSGGSVTASNRIISSLSVGANSNIIFSVDLPMAVGETLTAKASSVTSVNLVISGIVIS